MEVSFNPKLPQCTVDAIGAGVTEWMPGKCLYLTQFGGGGLTSEGNSATCGEPEP